MKRIGKQNNHKRKEKSMHSIVHDESERIIGILPELREHATHHERFGKYATSYSDFRRLFTKLFERKGYPTGKSTMDRLMRLFLPFEKLQTRFVDKHLLQTILIPAIPEKAVFDILYFHHCWGNPLLRQLLEKSFYPYMKARDQITRERVMADLEDMVGKYSTNTVKDAFFPLRNHGFMEHDRRTATDQFTYRTVHPLAFLYACYRELERLNLKILGVHRLDSLMELDFTKWLLLTRSQLTDIVKQLDEENLAGYSFQIEEQLHIKFSLYEMLDRLRTMEECE